MSSTRARSRHDWNDLATRTHSLTSSPHPAPLYDALWLLLQPAVEAWLETPSFLGRVAEDDDLRREILVRTWVKLRDRDHACLRAFAARSPASGPQLRAYLYRVIKNLGTDYLRSLPELARGGQGEPHSWRVFVEWSPDLEAGVLVGNPDVRGALVRRMLRTLDDEDERGRARGVERRWYRPALELWSCGYAPQEVAERLDMPDPATAARVIDAAKELLRRRFRDAG